MNSFKLRLQSLWSAALAFGVLLAAPAVFGQAAFFDFNTPGQLTNNFGVRNKTAGQAAVWHETNSFGVGGSRALEGVIGSGNFNTITYLGDGFPFPVNDGATLNMSIFYRGKVSSQAGPVAQMLLGLIGYSNNVAIATNNFIEGNSVVSWLNLRTSVSGTTGLGFEYGIYMTTNNGNAFNTTTFEYSNKTTTAIGVVNATFTNWYKLSATFVRTNTTNVMFTGVLDSYGTFGTAFQSNVMTLAPTVVTGRLSFPTTVYPAFEAIENAGVDNIDNFAVWMTNGAARVTAPPTSQAISTYRSATFVAKSDGTPPIAYTWYTNGVIVGGGATNATYTTPVQTAAGSISVYVAVTNAIDGADSSASPATLTVTADATAPSVVSVGSVDGKTFGVAFSEAMDPTGAAMPGNYSVTGGTVTNAALRPDGRVALTLSAPISGAFTVTVSGVTDLAGNPLSGNSAGGTVLGLTPTDVGSPLTTGSSFSSSQGDIDQVGGGFDFSNLADQGHFAAGVRTGDFDIRVRVQGLQRPRGTTIFAGRDEGAQAGIVAKENFEAGSRMMRAFTSPLDTGMPVGSNTIGNAQRTTTLGAAANISAPLAKPAYAANGYYPNMWLRLRRVNNTFTTYYETNAIGSNWIAYGTNTTVMTPNMVVGPATFARTDEYNLAATAQYRAYGDWSVAGAALGFAVNLSATNTLNVTWPGTNASLTLTVTATNTGTIFPSNEIQFVWQRSDGLGGFTNIPSVAAQPASTPFTNSAVSSLGTPAFGLADSGVQFRVIAKGPGGLAATSVASTIIITANNYDVAAPAVVSSTMLLGSNVLSLVFSGQLSLSTISNLANFTITNSLGQVITVNNVILEQPGVGTNNVTRLLLFTSTVLTNNTSYFVRLNNLAGTNGTPVALNTIASVATPGTVKVELFMNLAASSLITDLTNTTKYLSNIADLVYWTNAFNFNHSGAAFGDKFNSYGGRISGYFVPPSNGVYRFYIRNDDPGQLWMNTNTVNTMEATGKVMIAYQSGANANYGGLLLTNMSTNITLVAGTPYYIEGLWKENSGGDGFALAFRWFANITDAAASSVVPPITEFASGQFFRPIVANPFGLVTYTNLTSTNFAGNLAPVRVDLYTNITGGNAVSLVTNSSKYINNLPDFSLYMPGMGYNSDLYTNGGGFGSTLDNYGARLTALFVAPSNAFYRFYVRGDDDVQMFMNTNGVTGADPAGKVSITYLSSWRPTYTNMSVQQSFDGVTNFGTSLPIYLSNGISYFMEVIMKDNVGGDGVGMTFRGFPDYATATNLAQTIYSNEVMTATFLRSTTNAFNPAWPYSPSVLAEIYTGVGGTAVSDLQNNGKFQAAMPDATFPMTHFGWNRDLNSSAYPGDNYGVRVSAYFVAPSNATYRFFLKSDDAVSLFMNTNGMDVAGKVQIATLGSFRATYANNDGTMSGAINLTNGQRYYMEGQMKEGSGGDGFSVTFFSTNAAFMFSTNSAHIPTAPNASFVTPSDFFAPTIGPVTANAIVQSTASPAGNVWTDGNTVTFTINGITGANPIGAQWKKNGVPIPGANGFTYTTPALTPADIGVITYSVSIYNAQSYVERSINLTVSGVNLDIAPPTITAAVGNGLQNEVTVTFSENVLPSTATNTANYSIAGLTITGAFLRAANQVALITSPQTAGARYTVVVSNVRDLSRLSNVIVPGSSFDFTSWNLQRGFVTVDLFTGLNNNTFVNALVGEPKFIWNTPDSTQYRINFGFGSVGGGADFADNYGARVYGWFIAPSNGTFRFYIRSDDQSQLFMNTNSVNSTDPAGKVGIAGSTLACCGVTYSDTSKGPVISPNISMVAGQLYYMEALFKEGGGGDGVSVAFREAGDPSVPPITEVIPGYFFASLGNPDITASFTITNQPVSATLQAGQLTTLRVGALALPVQFIAYQWQWLNGAVWTDVGANTNLFGTNFAFTTTFTTAGTFQYRALAIVPGYMRTSSVATITVTNAVEVVPTGPILTGASTTNGIFVRAFFNEPVTELTATNVLNYLLTNHLGGAYTVTNAVLLSDAQTVVLGVSTRLTPGNLTNYTLVVTGVADVDDALTGGGIYTFYAPDGVFYANVYQQAGVSLTAFPLSTPSFSSVVSNSLLYGSGNLNGATDAGNPYITGNIDSFVARLSGFIIPASNGLYQFWLSSDDGSQFFMNTNSVNSDSPTGMVQLLAAGAFNAFASFAPTPYITLRAGQRYYFEGRLQDGSGGDAFAVTMRESRDPSPLIGPFRVAPPLTASNQLTSLLLSSPPQLTLVPTPSLAPSFVEDATNLVLGTVIGVPAYIQWYSNNVLIAGATNATFPLPSPLPLSYNGATVQVIATNFFTGVISNQFAISVSADATAPTITGIFRDSTGTNIIVTFSEIVNSNSAVLLANYALSDGSPVTIVSVRLRPDGRSVIISIAPSGGLNPSTAYTVTVNNVTDRAATPNTIVAASTASTPALTLTTGFLAVDLFTNISANAGTAIQITNLFNDVRFINNQPDLQTTIGSLDFRTTNMPWAGILNYGAKIHGWFTPPATAVYRFYWRSDDFSQLFMNTNGATPSGKVQIGGPVGAGIAYSSSTSVSLTMGTAYYIEWDMAQGTGNEYFQATWRSFADATTANAAGAPIAAGSPGTGWPNAIYPSAEVAAGAHFGLYGDASTVSNLNITLQPTPSATNVGANTLVSFSVGATNDGANKYLFYQWQADNGLGTFTNLAPLAAYTSDYAMLGNRSNYSAVFGYSATLRVVATLPGGLSITSSTATVTVTNAYNFFTAGSLGGTNAVVLTFDKPLDPGSVGETSNFVINEGAVSVTSATQTGRTVTVNLSAPISGDFRVQVFQVLDATLAFLTPDDGSSSITVTGRVVDASFVNDVGSAPGTTDPLVRGTAVSLAPNSLDITAGGSDIFGAADGMYYVARQITGNFDVRVRVAGLTNFYRGLSDANAKASITARPLTNGNSRSISATIAPPVIPSWPVAGANGAQFIFRDTVGGSSTAVTLGSAWQTPLGPWIRLVRSGSGFFAFRSLDGTNWVLISSRDTAFNGGAYPDTIFVGFGATSHNNVTNVTPGTIVANLRDIYFPLVPTITSQPTGATNGLGANITLTVTATTPPNSGALTYQWRRSGTNLIGSTGSSFSITGANVSDSGAYTVLVGNDGGGVISSNALVLITNALPTVASETVGAVQNVTTNYTPGTLLANNTDPEGRPLSIAAVSGIFPVTFYTDFEAGLPAGTAIFGNAHLAASVGVTNSQALALTDAVGGQSGAFIISNLVPGRSVSAFSASFQIRIGGGSGNPADGMSFNIASDLPTAGSEDGVGTGLSICLDNYDNGNLEAPALGIKWRGAFVTHVPIAKVNSTAWQPVLVTLRANGTIDVSVNGAALVSNLQTPYTPITGASFGFYARTGGEFETHWLDEIGITVLTPETTTSGLTTSYSSDFTYGLPPGMTLYGLTNAYWTNLTGVGNSGALHLNDTVNNAAGAAVIDEIVTNRPVYSFTASFKLRIASGAEGADGMSFNFANDLPNAVSGGAEEGVGTGLSLCFDIYRFPDNVNANRSGLKLKYRGNTIAQVQTPVWNSASYIPVVMSLSANGVVTVSVDGTNAFANVPTSYVPSRGRFGFYARTGGANETHWIDDLNIVLPDNGYVTLGGTNVNYLPPRNGCGTDTFYYQVSDGQGGLAWDSATVQLLDVTAPTVLQTATNRTIFFTSCSNTLPNLTLTAVSGLVVTDACSLTLTQSPLAGTLMGTGVTTVTIYAVDAGTNITTITTFVTNRDNTIPTISCPANVVVLSDPGFCYASGVSIGTASASDNCLIAVTNNAPTPFPVGITVVTWTAVDVGGNTNACTQTVTVIDPAAANVAAYEPFVCYTEGSLSGQTVRGIGFAGSWSSGGGDVLVTNAASLTYVSGSSILGVEGGRAFTPAAGFNTMFAGMNTNLSGVFSNLMDGGRIGGPSASGTLYFSFLARNASGDLTGDEDFAGLELFDDGSEVLGIGNNWGAWAYSLFGPVSGDVDLTNNTGGFISMNANTHLFVARIDYASGADDTVTVWMDPDIAASEAGQGNLYRRTFTGNARFNRLALRSGSNNNDNSWDFDEIRFGSSWGNVTPSGIAITTQPASQTANCGSTVNFTVVTASLVTPDYRWRFNGNLISNATNSTLNLVSVSTNDVGSYTVIVSNRFGSLTSSVATLTVTNTPLLISPAGPLLGGVLDNACGSLVLAGGSAYRWELTNATGSAGSGWDVLNVTGGIDVQATTGNPFTVNLWSLNGSVAGPAANWNNDTTNVFTIATVTDAVTNFSADKFTLNDANFANDLAGGVFSIEEGSLNVRFLPNHAPVANASTNNRAPGLTLKIKITNLLATATGDVDGDGRALIGLGASTNGATITTNTDYIFYSSTNNLAEAISYTVRDLRSYRAGDTVRTAAALLYFTAEAPSGTNGNAVTISFTNGVVGMRFAGIPGYAYHVQRTEDLTPPATWTTLHTTNCPPLGLFDFIDTAPPMGAAYYRTAQP